ncbi:MAG: hypothetical protein KBS95_01310 [Alistipes sp.]|nr:hypothetical protein [Candidatus Alistipes equi]
MFSDDELNTILSSEFQEEVSNNISRNALDIAVDRHIPNARLVATLVKYLERAKKKLPTFYEARAVMHEMSFEQSSSEECARAKGLSGDTLLDLSFGLGVDSVILSKNFKDVTAIEISEPNCRIGRENLKRLGISNVHLYCSRAEEFLEKTNKEFDWILIDPDRRSNGKKMVLLEDCSPNILEIEGLLRKKGRHVCIKCSPLFDTKEAFRLFPDCHVEVVAMHNETKEVNIFIDGSLPRIIVRNLPEGSIETPWPIKKISPNVLAEDATALKYLFIPSPAIDHARMLGIIMEKYNAYWEECGIALMDRMPTEMYPGQLYYVEQYLPFSPKLLKSTINGNRSLILLRNFDMGISQLRKMLKTSEGTTETWCFSRIENRRVAFRIKKVNL